MGLITVGDPGRTRRVTRPVFRSPSPTEVFSALLAQSGLTHQLSQAGTYLSGVIDLWGGFDSLAADWSDASITGLLQCYLRARTEASEDSGVYLDVPKRWFLNARQMLKSVGISSDRLVNVLDSLTRRGILTAGLLLKCPRCRLGWWYEVAEVGKFFACQRCRFEARVNSDAWRKPELEPHFFYQLDEVAYQALRHDCQVPVLALKRLKQESSAGFMFESSLDVFDGGRTVAELDICAIVDGTITLGEAKRSTDIPMKQMRKVVELLGRINGHRLCIATSQQWDPKTIRAAESLVASNFELMVLEHCHP